jgi:2-oxoglutarate ferredoxin oxidoreductase subunit beta
VLELEHGKPMRFGKDREKGIMLGPNLKPEVVDVAAVGENALLVHDETSEICALILSRFTAPEFPTPIGVFRAVSRPSYDTLMTEQLEQAKRFKHQSVQELLDDGHYTVT